VLLWIEHRWPRSHSDRGTVRPHQVAASRPAPRTAANVR
jgi:hypothetical protein